MCVFHGSTNELESEANHAQADSLREAASVSLSAGFGVSRTALQHLYEDELVVGLDRSTVENRTLINPLAC